MYRSAEKTAARMGLMNQLRTIFSRATKSIRAPANRSQPMIAPTMACVVETG